MSLLPPARPDVSQEDVAAWIRGAPGVAVGVRWPYLVGRRGYYRDSMGAPGVNDFGLYDDAIVLVTSAGVVAFNANTDPSRQHAGVAVLAPGQWRYRLGTHGVTKPVERQYEALVQAGPVTVLRQDAGRDTGWFGINIHHGGLSTTSSEGCQTIAPGQWAEFLDAVKAAMRAAGVPTIAYLLTERPRA